MHKLLPVSIAIALLFAGGCKRSPALKPTVVQVITNAQEVAAARQAWSSQREQRLAELLAKPENIHSYDRESVELLQSQPERSRAALTRLRDDNALAAENRLQAACALKPLGVAPSPEQLVGFARASNEAGRALLLAAHGDDLWKKEEPLPEPVRKFVVESLVSVDSRLRNSAVQLVSWRKVEEAAGPLAALAQKQKKPDMQLLRAAARLRPSPELLKQLEAQLKPTGAFGGNGALGAIAELGEAAKEPALKAAAAAACARVLQQQPDLSGIDGDSLAAVGLVASLQPPEAAIGLLTNLVRSGKWRLVREMALGDLQKLNPAAATALAKETGLTLSGEGDGRRSTAKSQRTMEELAEICVRHGVLTRAEADSAIAKCKQPLPDKALGLEPASAEALFFAADRFLTFDVETDMCPNRHDLLLQEFAKASAGRFKPEAPLEDYQDPQPKSQSGRWVKVGLGRYRVQFVHQDRLYKFEPNDLGDWYDVAALIAAIHRALEDAGVAERFVALESGGQDAGFVFGRPEALGAAAAELDLKLGADLDKARKLGTEFEEKALKAITRQR